MGLSSSTKTTQVEMTKASSGLGPLMTNSPHSLHSQTKGVLLMTSCLGTLVYSTGHQSPCWYVHLPAGRNDGRIFSLESSSQDIEQDKKKTSSSFSYMYTN